MAERRDEMNKRKAEMEKRKVEFESKLRNQGLSYGSYGYSQSYSQKFEGESVEKFCPNCKVDKEVSLDDNFCSDCGKKLELSSKIKEIDEHSYSHETSRKNNNRRGGSGGGFGNATMGGLFSIVSLISLVAKLK